MPPAASRTRTTVIPPPQILPNSAAQPAIVGTTVIPELWAGLLATDDFDSGHFVKPSINDALPYGFVNPWPTGPCSSLEASEFNSFEILSPPKLPSPSVQSDDPNDPASTTSSVASYSNCTTLSPVNTDFQSGVDVSYDGAPAPPTLSRGPSPLRFVTNRAETDILDMREPVGLPNNYLCLGPHCDAKFSEEDELQDHVNTVHSHTCNWASCRVPGFKTREGLNWHVKAEHLLICPVRGCGESENDFQTKKILDSHIRVAHPNANPEALEGQKGDEAKGRTKSVTPVMPPPAPAPKPDDEATRKPTPAWDAVNDPATKMALSIVASKKRCQERLKSVLEKKLKRAVGTPHSVGTPRSIGSPQDVVRSRTPRLLESANFPLVWEHGVLPFLIEFIPKWCGPGHVISVARGRTPTARRICIMTKKKISRARKVFIAVHVRDLLPGTYRQSSSFHFSAGEVDRLVWARGVSKDELDDLCKPRNPFCYTSPCMGDSIGTTLSDAEGESTATLGPCLIIGGANYWLANFHPFVETYQSRDTVRVEHPSPRDRERCVREGHDALSTDTTSFSLGDLIATSGIDLETTRVSHDSYWEENDKEPPLVVTDWTLISSRDKQANMLRKFPTTSPRMRDVPITVTSVIVPGANVLSTGRTSGHQRGQVCEIPAYVSGDSAGNGTGRATREWFVEEPYPYDNEDGWIRGGIGVEGDSGAVIVDADTNALLGQLWGRNKYFGSGPRHTFFTPINDIMDDIQEKCGQEMRPQLPQYRDDSERWAVYPLCKPCFDLSTYLDSRRSSRESLRSMLGRSDDALGIFGEDPDLTSVEAISELATPKDQGYWTRHAGQDEAGSSFTSIVSPTPFTSFTFNLPAGSPRIAEMRSPYAVHLDTDGFSDTEFDPSNREKKKRRTA